MNIFVFGAGASAPAGFPLGKDLTRLVKQWLPSEKLHLPVWEELERTGTFRPAEDFELNLTRLDLEIATHRRQGTRATVTADGQKHDLAEFRAWVLSEAIRNPLETHLEEVLKTPDRFEYFRRLIRKHVRSGDSFISFNYDCLLEAVLRQEGLWRLGDGYGVDLRPLYPELGGEPASPCTVFKLHGSAGWFFAVMKDHLLIDLATSSRLIGYPEMKRTTLPRGEGVVNGQILPSFVKGFSRHPIPLIWRQAAEAIARADRLAFIGYSFPEADAAARMLFLTNKRPCARAMIFSYREDEFPGMEALVCQFEGAGLKEVFNVKSCIENMGEIDSLWPDVPSDAYCGHRRH